MVSRATLGIVTNREPKTATEYIHSAKKVCPNSKCISTLTMEQKVGNSLSTTWKRRTHTQQQQKTISRSRRSMRTSTRVNGAGRNLKKRFAYKHIMSLSHSRTVSSCPFGTGCLADGSMEATQLNLNPSATPQPCLLSRRSPVLAWELQQREEEVEDTQIVSTR